MLHKTRAIVLHHVSYGESSIIVALYTEGHGRISCMVNSVRTKKPKFAATLFQPLTILEVDYYQRPNREVQRLKDAVSPVHYRSIPYNHTKSAIALFLAEVLYLVLREEESNPVLFAYLYNALQLLDNDDEGNSGFHHWFMLHLTKYLGFFPPERSLHEFYFQSSDMQSFQGLRPPIQNALIQIAENPQGPPDLGYLSQHDRNQLLESIIRYFGQHIDGFSRLRSFPVLQEVFEQRTNH